MKIRLLSVGRPCDRECEALHDRYAERIRRFGVEYETGWVGEIRGGRKYSDAHVREREGEALLRALAPRGCVVALDPRGTMLDSETLAGRLEGWTTPGATFLVGGPLGLSPAVRERADLVWSLSALTFPHELVRVLAAEQLYRAMTILRGAPYHKNSRRGA